MWIQKQVVKFYVLRNYSQFERVVVHINRTYFILFFTPNIFDNPEHIQIQSDNFQFRILKIFLFRTQWIQSIFTNRTIHFSCLVSNHVLVSYSQTPIDKSIWISKHNFAWLNLKFPISIHDRLNNQLSI